MPIDLKKLNKEQRQAVETTTGALKIIAGAGTGKTRTITYRAINQIYENVFKPQELMVITYTDKAAAELRERLFHLDNRFQIRTCTVHAAAYAQIRYFWKYLSNDSMPELYTKSYEFFTDFIKNYSYTANEFITDIDLYREGITDKDIFQNESYIKLIKEALREYKKYKYRRNLMDYNDILEFCLALKGVDVVINEIRNSYKSFTIDEFQDTNKTQFELFRMWDGGRNNICVVGDPAQTIFEFTGADSKYIQEFADFYPNCKEIKLSISYRATSNIIKVTNQILPDELDLKSSSPKLGNKPFLYDFDNDQIELDHILYTIKKLHKSGIDYKDMAILLRLNSHASTYENALADNHIPYQRGTDAPFFSWDLVKDLVAAILSAKQQELYLESTRPPIVGKAVYSKKKEKERIDNILKKYLSWSKDKKTTNQSYHVAISTIRKQLFDDIDTGMTYVEAIDSLKVLANNEFHLQQEAVHVLTMHKSKGMEFHTVFIPALEDGTLPFIKASTTREVIAEKKLFYVAATRAKENLYMSYARQRYIPKLGAMIDREPSPFTTNLKGLTT